MMKRFFSWSRRKSQPAPIHNGAITPDSQDPFLGPRGGQRLSPDSEGEFTLAIPGAFPESPPSSPVLSPTQQFEESQTEAYPFLAEPEPIHIDLPLAPELPTELGSHLHPRRPIKFTPSPQRVRPVQSAPPKQTRRPLFQDDLQVDDPWCRQSQAFEKLPFGRPVSAVQLFYPEKKPLPANRIASIFAPAWEKREKERLALEREQGRPARIIPKGPFVVRELSFQWLNRVSEAMRYSQGHAVARSPSGDDLFQKDIATCIKPLAWLNDEIINSYLTVIVQYLRQSTENTGPNERPRFHAFNTFFYSTLRDKGYQGVRRWANRAKIGGTGLLDVDTVFIPVHQHSHWTLMVVRPAERTIEYFDSLGDRGHSQVKTIKGWLRGELSEKFIEDEWTFLPSVSSHQDNGSDCGVFLLTNAKAVALGIEPTAFGPDHTTLLRRKIVAELMNGGLHGEFSPIDVHGDTLL
ncbi:hypothetical protein N7462_004843 [Penicillium macrosclerotiorum]|uniref:uncharacterized protein n=1 Tax=Penicillium macrosclerotiorum TaxID=303699 RepID=UPI0025485E16|nr:uncharacterized protein N7462_004843 [Penicillium macrosclerotiorum]KAJ5690451.1 hypothetical protein N7462_004843 [Penicillium macrosclerotiorum]